ncbi:hypothetical protein G6011_06576 [Alternaria panax]|uniref:Uncharacterized protein n=1 Tax=Alternaria panax TaxID=48097 RepID=A0AAD4FIQ1_9PLEO|nr:hypothetical protein G6011_06576 [Alternaria panax]
MPSKTPLFPNLPPELRNEIYAYLSLPSSSDPSPLNTHLPLGLKTFSCKHTTINLIPTHHGSTSLLSLPPAHFEESAEYSSYLLSNAITLRIGVHFHGRVNTFVQTDWNKKVATHLNKLAKSFPWLRKVARYEIQVLWEPVDGVLKSRDGKRVAGRIPLGMVTCLTQLMDAEAKRKRGDVKVGLCLDDCFAVTNALSDTKFGLDTFLFDGDVGGAGLGFKRLVREVRKRGREVHLPRLPHPRFLAVPPVRDPKEDTSVEVLDGVVRWSEWTRGPLVMARTLDVEAERGSVLTQGKGEAEFPMCHLMAECVTR